MVKILIGVLIWQLVTTIVDIIGGNEISEKVGCGIWYFGWLGIKKLRELIGK